MNSKKLSETKFLKYDLQLFLGWGSYENPRENQVGGICFWSPTVSIAQEDCSHGEVSLQLQQ
jgi:hypothetical protein